MSNNIRKSDEFIIKTLFKVGMAFTVGAWLIDWCIYLLG